MFGRGFKEGGYPFLTVGTAPLIQSNPNLGWDFALFNLELSGRELGAVEALASPAALLPGSGATGRERRHSASDLGDGLHQTTTG